MENEFKGRVIFSENYQSTIDSIKLINKSVNSRAAIIKSSSETIDLSRDSDIRIIKSTTLLARLKTKWQAHSLQC